jgi:hypothetical protein
MRAGAWTKAALGLVGASAGARTCCGAAAAGATYRPRRVPVRLGKIATQAYMSLL